MYYKKIYRKETKQFANMSRMYESFKERKDVIVGEDNNGEYILYPIVLTDSYVSELVSRQAIGNAGYNDTELTDEEIQYIADELADRFIGNNYYEHLEKILDEMNVSKVDED